VFKDQSSIITGDWLFLFLRIKKEGVVGSI